MTPIQRIDSRLAELSAEYSRLTLGKAVLPPKAKTIAAKIAQLRQERDRLIADERHSLGTLLPTNPDERNEIYRLLIKLPIISDFLYNACVELQGVLKRHGLNELTMTRRVGQISEMSKDFAFLLSEFPELEKILSADDTLIEALNKKVDSFLSQRMKIKQ